MKFVNKQRYVFCIAFFFNCLILAAQDTSYFQQELSYKIKISLSDRNHTARAFEEIRYKNNSARALDTIFMHLWPNAYKNNQTALAKQQLRNGKTELYYAKDKDLGFIDSLDFKINGKAVRWQLDKKNIDICYLLLDQPLKPGESIEISTPFFLKIPDARFSRLGHTGQAYFMTQWYPKPAVFDRKGWHAMPYLDQGEFYSEYGDFDVSITLPENYLLSATGDRIDADAEIAFLNGKVAETKKHIAAGTRYDFKMNFPPSSEKMKTVRFKQYRVHDFAWVADKRFYVLTDKIEMPVSKRMVDTWIFFTDKNFDLWKKALDYVGESAIFYSFLLGDYPYNHVTAVDGTIMAGGGMEYPNITIIGDASNAFELDMVIAHEVGHNWFYGILGSNEREHPFMDEGLNSLYEMRYVRAKYGDKKLGTFIGRDSIKLFGLNHIPLSRYHELSYFSSMKMNSDQSMNLPAPEYSDANYGSVVYSKTALAFDYLLDHLGEQNFDLVMKDYYEKYKFKHPYPEDLFKVLAGPAGVNIDWFVKNLYETRARYDFKIKKAQRNENGSWTIQIKNKTGSIGPFSVTGFNKNKAIGEVWSKGEGKNITLEFPPAEISRFTIDAQAKVPEMNRRNNSTRTRGIFKKVEPISAYTLFHFEDPQRTQFNLFPIMGVNAYDGYMLGLTVNNYAIYQKKLEYHISPMYAFNSKGLSGYGEINYNILPANNFRQVTIGMRAKSFAYDYFVAADDAPMEYLRFLKLSPYIRFDFKKKDAGSSVSRSVTYTSHQLFTDSVVSRYQPDGMPAWVIRNQYSFVNELTYVYSNRRTIDPCYFSMNLQHTASMAKVFASFDYKINLKKNVNFDLRVFGGAFLAGSLAERSYYAFRASGYTGAQDFTFEGNFYDRFPAHNNWAFGQFLEKDGALKVWTPLGQSSEWMLGINLKSPRFFKTPFHLFADAVTCDGRSLNEDKILWDAGISMVLVQDIVEVYLPLFYSNDISHTLELNNMKWFNTFRFTFNIHKLEPRKILHSSIF